MQINKPKNVASILSSFHKQEEQLLVLEADKYNEAAALAEKAARLDAEARATWDASFAAEAEAKRAADMVEKIRDFITV